MASQQQLNTELSRVFFSDIRTKPAEGIFAAEPPFVHAGDFGHRLVILQPPAMGETRAADEAVEGKRL